MSTPKLPPDLAVTRPAVFMDETAEHPSMGPMVGPPPAKYTLAVKDMIVQYISEGQRPRVAAAMAGITVGTFDKWMKQGREGHPHLWELADAVDRAVAIAEGQAVAVITAKGTFDASPENAKWFLERRFADGYSKEAATKVNAMLEDFFKRLEANLPPDVFQMVIAAAAGQPLPGANTPASLPEHGEEDDPDTD